MPLFDPLHDPAFRQTAQERMQVLQGERGNLVSYRSECLYHGQLLSSSLQESYDRRRKACCEALCQWMEEVHEIFEALLQPVGVFRGAQDAGSFPKLCSATVGLTERTLPLKTQLASFLQWESEAEESSAYLTGLGKDAVLLQSAASGEEKDPWRGLAEGLLQMTAAQEKLQRRFSLQRSALLSFATSALPRFQKEFSDRCDLTHEGAALSRSGLQSLLGEMEREVKALVAELQDT